MVYLCSQMQVSWDLYLGAAPETSLIFTWSVKQPKPDRAATTLQSGNQWLSRLLDVILLRGYHTHESLPVTMHGMVGFRQCAVQCSHSSQTGRWITYWAGRTPEKTLWVNKPSVQNMRQESTYHTTTHWYITDEATTMRWPHNSLP